MNHLSSVIYRKIFNTIELLIISKLEKSKIYIDYMIAKFSINVYFNVIYHFLQKRFTDGMFRGFDVLVWILILMNSAGGLLISVVIKYADNIAKTYAQVNND